MTSVSQSSDLMELDRAIAIVKAIYQRCICATDVVEKVNSLEGVSLSQMLAAKDRLQLENATSRSVDGVRRFYTVPDDRLIAAAYALEHYDGDENAIVVVPGRDMFGEPCRKALGVVQLEGLTDEEGEE
ncbi:hypothetical protein [Sinorhizobium meliloti]|uniref:hypothetical protein n=1 Tax=Rhizobium meliloti TaxID=382 RepID=UPI003F192B89